ncbi:MAG: tRNA (adenosine(37)-N6)-threonylcarbamoyltransferase complex transferase subunit TsaD [Flavobacteriales bacterium]|nr:tRNA (adenosine(37)-N6)-threonylcarbamoyltransferase complex transferase subunit TsaD [Flavobacteriales bacterium]
MRDAPCILAIESSCDDTGVAVIRGRQVLSNVVAGQEVHEQFGGVVPELASRAHAQHIVPTVQQALKDAGISPIQLSAVAYTQGPGLMGSLHVGAAFAKSWAWAHGLPLVPVHHMHAHVLAHYLAPGDAPSLPFLCLTVSGGHTQLVRVEGPREMEVLGSTLDDAAGEAFDKVAKLLGLPYPGGPILDRLSSDGDENAFEFSHPKVAALDMSFSGLKTQVLYFLQRSQAENPNFISERLADIAASVQRVIVEILMRKLEAAVSSTGIKEVAIAGGVSANRALRKALEQRQNEMGWKVHIPPMAYCTDNAAMIAMAGSLLFQSGVVGSISDAPNPRLPF